MDYYIVSDDRWFLLGLSTISARVCRHVSLVYPEPGPEYISPVRGDVIVINIRNAGLRAALLQRWVLAFCRVIILTHPNIVATGNVVAPYPWIVPDNVTLDELSEYLLRAGKTPVEHKGITGRDRKVLYHFAMSLPPSGLYDILGLKTKSVCVLKTSIIKNYGLKGCHASALSLIMDLTGIKRPVDVPSPGCQR